MFSLTLFSAKMGIKGGFNFSLPKTSYEDLPMIDVYGIEYQTEDFRGLDYNALGFCLSIPVAKRIDIQLEIFYVVKGMQRTLFSPVSRDYYTQKWKNHYLELPVLIKFNITQDKTLNPFFSGGLYLGYLITDKWSYYTSGELYRITGLFPEDTDSLKKFDYGILVAAGVDFKISLYKLVFEVRLNIGLPDLAETDNQIFHTFKNLNLCIYLGLIFK